MTLTFFLFFLDWSYEESEEKKGNCTFEKSEPRDFAIAVLWNHGDPGKIQSKYDILWLYYVSYVFGIFSKVLVVPEYGGGKVETTGFSENAIKEFI